MHDEIEEEVLDGDEALRLLGQDPDAIVGLILESAAWVLEKLNPEIQSEEVWEKVQGFVEEGLLDDVVSITISKMEELEDEGMQ